MAALAGLIQILVEPTLTMNLREIFLAARNIPDLNHRQAFIDEACGSDAGLKQMLQSVLEAYDKDAELPHSTTTQQPVVLAARDYGQLGPYRLRQILGQGGMGMVYRADDITLNRQVAVKVLLPTAANDPKAQERFLREATAAAQLDHENVVPIYHIGDAGGIPYLVMPLLRGESLDRWIERGKPCTPAQLVRLAIQVTRGLAAAHAQGLIHRDIKPGNIWLDEDTSRARILDFGLARGQDAPAITQTGMVVGTPGYMAPEQALGERLDGRCDLFSLGAVLYQLATGQLPFKGPTAAALLTALVLQTPQPISQVVPAFPKELGDLIMQLLARNPDERPENARVVLERLHAIAEKMQPATDPLLPAGDRLAHDTDHIPRVASNPTQPPPPRRRRWVRWVGLIGAGLALAALVLLWLGTRPGYLDLEVPESDVELWVDGVQRGNLGSSLNGKFELPPGPRRISLRRGEQEFLAKEIHIHPGQASRVEGTWLPRRFTNRLGVEFVLIPGGTTWLGGTEGRLGDRRFTLVRDIFLSRYEITQGEWEKVMGSGRNPSRYSRNGEKQDAVKHLSDADLQRLPADSISYNLAQEFLKRLNATANDSGWVYMLPTADEWEYACRGGPNVPRDKLGYDFYLEEPTNTLSPQKANFAETNLSHPWKVGSGRPNAMGLYDMHGNVFELCDDAVEGDKPGEILRYLHGGCWTDPAELCNAGRRSIISSRARFDGGGLRIARVPVGR